MSTDNSPRILVIPSWYPPDGGYFFREHSEAIKRCGWEVDVLVNRVVGVRKVIRIGPSALRRWKVADENGLRVIRSVYLKIPGSEKHNIRRWSVRTKKLFRKYQRRFGKPGLILVHSVTWAGYAASLIREKYGIPYLVVEHRSFFVWSTKESRDMVRPYYLPFFERAYRLCSRLILVSNSLKKGLEALMPWIGEKITVIPNMIREDMFLPPEATRDRDPFVFLWAGRLEHVKGLDILLDAVRKVMDRSTVNFTVRLAGRGSLRNKLEEMAERNGVDNRVHFLGRISREDMQEEMQKANCFVLPSRYEAFGAVLIEAMATGMPVIATLSGGPDSIVKEECGLLVDPENAEQLAVAMIRMMERYDSYSREWIRIHTMENYGESRVMEQYNRLFLEFVNE